MNCVKARDHEKASQARPPEPTDLTLPARLRVYNNDSIQIYQRPAYPAGVRDTEVLMADMLLKGVPERIKAWIAAQAQAHRRSMTQEAISLFVEAHAAGAVPARSSEEEIRAVLRSFRSLPRRKPPRSAEQVIDYDKRGLPR